MASGFRVTWALAASVPARIFSFTALAALLLARTSALMIRERAWASTLFTFWRKICVKKRTISSMIFMC